jgi:hypothetical protein
MGKDEKTCPYCGIKEGELHHHGCGSEVCPFCAGQLVSCDCVYDLLDIFDEKKYTEETDFLPPDIYNDGITREMAAKWIELLNKKGRIPYIIWPNICRKCGELWPQMFKVSDEEWEKYISPRFQDSMVCKSCYDEIKRKIDVAEKREPLICNWDAIEGNNKPFANLVVQASKCAIKFMKHRHGDIENGKGDEEFTEKYHESVSQLGLNNINQIEESLESLWKSKTDIKLFIASFDGFRDFNKRTRMCPLKSIAEAWGIGDLCAVEDPEVDELTDIMPEV